MSIRCCRHAIRSIRRPRLPRFSHQLAAPWLDRGSVNNWSRRSILTSSHSPPSRSTHCSRSYVAVIIGIGALATTAVALFCIRQEPILFDSLTSSTIQPRHGPPLPPDSVPMRERMEHFIKEQQRDIIRHLEDVDGCAKFRIDEWQRPEGGGGITCVLQDGQVFEKAGLGVSVIHGKLTRPGIIRMRANHRNLVLADADDIPVTMDFFAAGLSLIAHPHNPMVPTVHLNYRYFETLRPDGTVGARWFGGGSDLTPSYLFREDAVHFHRCLKDACDRHDASYYPRFKKWCDEYFVNKHRNESRGIGGIFFDDLDEEVADPEKTFAFIQDCLRSFLPSYLPIVQRRKDLPYTPAQKEWQQLRRGRYVEFNLVHDRGTSFGLNTPNARVESILMSLPLTATWKYMHQPDPGSKEEELIDILKQPKEWV